MKREKSRSLALRIKPKKQKKEKENKEKEKDKKKKKKSETLSPPQAPSKQGPSCFQKKRAKKWHSCSHVKIRVHPNYLKDHV